MRFLLFGSILLMAIMMHIIPRYVIDTNILNVFNRRSILFRSAVYAGAILLFLGLTLDAPSFIYFQF